MFSFIKTYIYSMLKTKMTDKPRVGWVCLQFVNKIGNLYIYIYEMCYLSLQ